MLETYGNREEKWSINESRGSLTPLQWSNLEP